MSSPPAPTTGLPQTRRCMPLATTMTMVPDCLPGSPSAKNLVGVVGLGVRLHDEGHQQRHRQQVVSTSPSPVQARFGGLHLRSVRRTAPTMAGNRMVASCKGPVTRDRCG